MRIFLLRLPVWLSFVLLSFIFGSCIKNTNPDIPAYIHVESIQLEITDAVSQGSGSENIVDAWLTVDDQLIGVNALPITLPILLNDSLDVNNVKIQGGIKDNGISTARAPYVFYAPYEVNLDLQPGEVDTIQAIVRYADDAQIILIDDFEGPGVAFGDDLDSDPETELIKTSEEVFEGNGSGKILIDSNHIECIVGSSFKYSDLQDEGTSFPVYLEMNFKTNHPFEIGLKAFYNTGFADVQYKGGVNETEGDWKKIYFNLTEDVFSLNADEYSVIFRAVKDAAFTDEPAIYIDNIKLVHF